MQRVLLIYGDNDFKVLSWREYGDYIWSSEPKADMVIYRSSESKAPDSIRYKCHTELYNTDMVRLAEFSEEIKALLVLYEI